MKAVKNFESMMELTIEDRISQFEIDFIEKDFGINIPGEIVLFLKKYSGMSVKEKVFYFREKSVEFIVNEFMSFTRVYDLAKSLFGQNIRLFPFANDPNGMNYFISFEEASYLKIGVLAIDLSKDFIIIAASFEEFINGLKREDGVQ
ncbi:MAG TPA: SMI1/KNR4 family protein [Chitinophagaceae bacterium]